MIEFNVALLLIIVVQCSVIANNCNSYCYYHVHYLVVMFGPVVCCSLWDHTH